MKEKLVLVGVPIHVQTSFTNALSLCSPQRVLSDIHSPLDHTEAESVECLKH
jgi:hypothetical protein